MEMIRECGIAFVSGGKECRNTFGKELDEKQKTGYNGDRWLKRAWKFLIGI